MLAWRLGLPVFFELHQSAQEIVRMDEGDPFARHIELRRAVAQHADALGGEFAGGGVHIVHAQAEMVDAAARISLQEFRDRRIRPRRLHQLDLGAADVDIGEPHALLLVEPALAGRQSVFLLQHARRRLDVRHDDRHVANPSCMPLSYITLSARNAAIACASMPSSCAESRRCAGRAPAARAAPTPACR